MCEALRDFPFSFPVSSLDRVSLQPGHSNTGILIRPFCLMEPDFFFFFFWCIRISFLEMLPLLSPVSAVFSANTRCDFSWELPCSPLSQFSSVPRSCPSLCDPMNCSTPGLPVHHQLPESTQLTSIESVMPSSHLILCRPLLLLPPIPPSIRVLSNESSLCISWPKYWSFSFNISPSNEHPGLISFGWTGWISLQSKGLEESSPTPQFKSINSLLLSFLHRPTLSSIHDHWKNHSLD